MDTIDQLRGNTTVFMVTHRPSHLKKADRVFVLHQGQLVLMGPPEQVLAQLPKDLL